MTIKRARKRRVVKAPRPRKMAPSKPLDVCVFLREAQGCSTGQDLEDLVSARLLRMGVFHENRTVAKVRLPSGQWCKFGITGESDITAHFPIKQKCTRVVRFECKLRSGKMSPEQKNYKAIIEALGQEYVVLKTVSDLDRWLVREGFLPKAAEQIPLS